MNTVFDLRAPFIRQCGHSERDAFRDGAVTTGRIAWRHQLVASAQYDEPGSPPYEKLGQVGAGRRDQLAIAKPDRWFEEDISRRKVGAPPAYMSGSSWMFLDHRYVVLTADHLLDDHAVGTGWEEVAFPGVADEKAYALEISGDSMLPLYRDGDTIIVSPTATVRRGDRVVVKTVEGEVLAKQLKRQTAKTVELASLNPEHPDRVLNLGEIAFMARVIWASQ